MNLDKTEYLYIVGDARDLYIDDSIKGCKTYKYLGAVMDFVRLTGILDRNL